MNTTLINQKLNRILQDLDDLRNPPNFPIETATDRYIRIYRNIGVIQGLVGKSCTPTTAT